LAGNPVPYIEDVFSTYLYTGNGSTQTITNGIDLAGKGGLVWFKSRDFTYPHALFDTNRGVTNYLRTNETNAQASNSGLTAFNSNGFSIAGSFTTGTTSINYASWTFRKQPKFFDVVTYTGTGAAQNIAHNLGSVPGCVIVKRTDSTGDWWIWHRSATNTSGVPGEEGSNYTFLQFDTDASARTTVVWNGTNPTSTVFTVGGSSTASVSGATYVAYLFAHNAGGFGLTGTDNVISCGSYTTDGSGNATVSLGYEPQWVMAKVSSTTGDWFIFDTLRGFIAAPTTGSKVLSPNTSAAEYGQGAVFAPTATGFTLGGGFGVNETIIYIAIRRGPMKVPTDATKVFNTVLQSPQSAGTVRTVGFPADLVIGNIRAGSGHYFQDRLRGFPSSGTTQNTLSVQSQSTAAEASEYPYFYNVWNTTAQDGDLSFMSNGVGWTFGRAPGFFDEVCYTGAGGSTVVNHNLGVAPFLVIAKARSAASNWFMFTSNGSTNFSSISLNSDSSGFSEAGTPASYGFTPTTFEVGGLTSHSGGSAGVVGVTYVAYLFATCPGVSKVGSYTGTGTTQQINCGFTAGSRFVLIKRTDSTGDWYVWDSARGIVAGNDPYLLLNSTAAEVTGTDYVDTYSAGFEISSTAPAAINASGGTFIFLAIA
jgi:hypothetical protein